MATPSLIQASAQALAPGDGAVISNFDAAPAWKSVPCRLCDVGCGLQVCIENGRAVAVRGDPTDPVACGLACAKGYYAAQALYVGDRLRRAMVRKNGTLVEVPIGEALDVVARTLRETIAAHGKDSVGVHGGSQWTVPDAQAAHTLFAESIGTSRVSGGAMASSAAARAGCRTTFGLEGAVGCYDDIDHADTIVLWDVNAAESDPVLFSRMLDRRRKNPGVRIVEVATRKTRTSYAIDRTILLAPRSIDAMAQAVAHELVKRNLTDRPFITRHVAFARGRTGIGYGVSSDRLVDDDARTASWNDYVAQLADFAPDTVPARVGTSAADIRWLASLYGDPARKVLSLWGAAVNQQPRGTYTNNLLYNLHLLTGKIASPGNGALPLSTATGGVPDTDGARGPHILEMFRGFDRGDIRFLWVQAANPLANLPNAGRYRRAAERRDRFLVVSDVVPTTTTRLADVVLPAAMWFEREGIDVNMERRLRHFDLLTAAPGDAMSDAWQMVEVARRLGHGKAFPAERRSHVEQLWNAYRVRSATAHTALPSMEAVRSPAGVTWPYDHETETRWRYNPAHDRRADRARGDFDFYGHADGRARIWIRPIDPPVEVPSREYPFWLSTGEVLEHAGRGTLTQRIPTLHRAVPGSYAEFNVEDAKQLGLRDQDRVRLSNARGAIESSVRIDYRSQPPRGVVFVPWCDETVPVATLMPDAFCPVSGQPERTLCVVRVERLTGATAR